MGNPLTRGKQVLLIWRLRKRVDQALIPISIIQKLPGLNSFFTEFLSYNLL